MNINKSIVIIVAVIAINISVQPSEGRYVNRPASMCGILSEVIVKKLVAKEAKELPYIDPNFAFIRAGNDVQCPEPEYMANVVIIAPKNPGEFFYGIFHIHFNNKGDIISVAAFIPWTLIKDELHAYDAEIWINWCEIIRSVYPNEMKEQRCQ